MQLVQLPVVWLLGFVLPIKSANDAILYTSTRFCIGAEMRVYFQLNNLVAVHSPARGKEEKAREVSVHLVEAREY